MSYYPGQRENEIFGRIIGVVITLVIIFIMFSNWIIPNYVVSEGWKAGTLVKVSNKGFIWKTNECSLALDRFRGTEAGTTNSFDFSMETTPNLENLVGTTVKVHYVNIMFMKPWQGASGYLVDKIEPVKSEK